MDFSGIQFGSLTSKIGKVINFEDLDLNADGKISEEEFATSDIFSKDGGFDTVEFSTVDKSSDKEISQEEFDIFEQEHNMEELVSNIYGQIATDFIGADAALAPEVKSALKDFIKEFSAEYQQSGQKIKNMAKSFSEVLPAKYEEIKAGVQRKTDKEAKGSYTDAIKEFDLKVPKNTTTKDEKALALEYIDKILACDDISESAKKIWTEQQKIIAEEMKHTLSEETKKTINEWREFTNKYWRNGWFPTDDARVRYYQKYVEFMDKILTGDELPEEYKQEYSRMKENAVKDLNNALKATGKNLTYSDILNEFKAKYPEITSIDSLKDKEDAISYIKKIIECKDIPQEQRETWQGTLAIFEREVQEMRKEAGNIFMF